MQDAIKCKQLIDWNILCAVNVLNRWQVLSWFIVGTVQNLFFVSVSRKLEKPEPSCMTTRSNWSMDHPRLFKDGPCFVDQSWGFKTELKQMKWGFSGSQLLKSAVFKPQMKFSFFSSSTYFIPTQSNKYSQSFNQSDTSRYCAAPLELLLLCSRRTT